ncbi:F0F1 ATP synthase subunit gamma [Roseomonas mucosa]|uniref:F0F1 ATP synthase subunit gamma n=1 Tax=Roseomonas mucosa TaxID=207340 RepID=UPI00123905DB|nr:F0F1 ATP synthase subunit gamma [Roseomonas mucosa]MDT8314194.1 F0F1 ATP synthase subunit gamma [Roseomonas mucosa]MDT8362310.1 F0F1 ATP synthase subunit gamma [Roseomonas mucosa]QET94402.1 F0F1 ATP synthase subunit gamma [Roseomonas mucosa]
MANLKALRARIASVKSTRKITQAMKMVAAAKLRRAQQQAEAARPYAERMERMLASLGGAVAGSPDAPRMLVGSGRDQVHLLIVVTGERGLAGAFNTNAGRFARNRIRELEAKGKTVKVITVGRKGATYLRRDFGSRFVEEVSYAQVKRLSFEQADAVAAKVTAMLETGEFDVCSLIYNRFHSVISQIPAEQQLIPAKVPAPSGDEAAPAASSDGALYEFEPGEEALLEQLLPKNLSIQVYRALLESAAGFYGAQMNAMDNATRNAGDMINKLTLSYNRTRQANITTELIEIISGASAV